MFRQVFVNGGAILNVMPLIILKMLGKTHGGLNPNRIENG
jgi:hypothetical protein